MQSKENEMIKEEYTQLLLSHQIRDITTIGDTQTLWCKLKKVETLTIIQYIMNTNSIYRHCFKCLFLFSLCLLLSCNSDRNKKARPDILQYEDYNALKEIHLPYILDIKNNNKHLVYYGAKHSFNPADSMFKEIEKRFNDLKPDIAFNEGGNEWPIINDRDSTIKLTGDPGFIRYLCRKNNVQVVSIDPSERLEYEHLLTKYKKLDVLLMYFCRQIDQLQHQVDISDAFFIKNMNGFLSDLKSQGMPLTVEEIQFNFIKSYYEKFFNLEFNWKEFDPANYQPIYSKTLLNEICRESTYFRDRFIINRIEVTLKTKDKIFVVMGGSHLVIQEPVLRFIMDEDK